MSVSTVALGHVVLDDLYRVNEEPVLGVLGGAGTYAALGAALIVPESGIVSGVGADFPKEALDRFAAAGISTDGLVALDPKTPRTHVQYFEDGEREETSRLGADHFSRLDPSWELVPESFRGAPGIYVFDAINPGLWAEIARTRAQRGTTVLWEIRADICRPEFLPAIVWQLSQVDILSINRTEILSLTEADTVEEALAELRKLVPVVALRLGSQGAVVAVGDATLRARPTTNMQVVDPTGAGNAFSGAFLAQWVYAQPEFPGGSAEAVGGEDALVRRAYHSLQAAMAAAAITIGQSGIPNVEPLQRAFARTVMENITVQLPTK